jgi:penicillin-binding protein 1A
MRGEAPLRSAFRRLVFRLLLIALVLTAGGYAWFSRATQAAPTPQQMRVMMTSAVIKRDQPDGEAKCLLPLFVDSSNVSAKFLRVLIETEDRSFRDNWGGLNVNGLFSAAVHGGFRRGGSSITQQLVKNIMFEPGDNRWRRKAYEIPWAILVSEHFTHEEILTAYLNHLPFRHGLYGIESASLFYFHKHASDLNHYESALLEVMLSNPKTDYASHDQQVRDNTVKKARNLLVHLVKTKRVPASAVREHVLIGAAERPQMDCGYTRDFVMREARQNGWLPNDGATFRIFITVNPNRQVAARAAADAVADSLYERNGSQLSLVNVDRGGRILALQGGLDYQESQYDRATDARRSPGSLGKIIVLAEACEQGYSLGSAISDMPLPGGRPRNDDGRYLGKVSVRNAFIYSRNAAFFRLAETLGPAKVAARAAAFGLHSKFPSDGGVAIGDFSATPLEMTAIVATISNGGRLVRPYIVSGITTSYGERAHWYSGSGKTTQAVSEKCAKMLGEAMGGVVKWGTGRNARIDDARGKTGTTNAYRDAWFVGYTKDGTALGIWMGNDEQQMGTNGIKGGSLPAATFRTYFEKLHENLKAPAIVKRKPPHMQTSKLDWWIPQ